MEQQVFSKPSDRYLLESIYTQIVLNLSKELQLKNPKLNPDDALDAAITELHHNHRLVMGRFLGQFGHLFE
jgi:hypothetical protein